MRNIFRTLGMASAFCALSGAAFAEVEGMRRSALGVTRAGVPIWSYVSEVNGLPSAEVRRILLVGGLDGREESTEAVRGMLEGLSAQADAGVAFSAVLDARPDGGADGAMVFPPRGEAYHQPENDVAHYLWRWIGMHGPDALLVVAKEGDDSAASLAEALRREAPCGVATVPCVVVAPGQARAALARLLADGVRPSPAAQELGRRVERGAVEVAGELAPIYGQKLEPVVYIPALALVGRMRLGELVGEDAALADARRVCEPYLSGAKESMPANGNGSTISGHLVFAELARRTGDAGWTALVKKAADYGFDAEGRPKECMPFHNEMSDSVFMGCAILAEAGALTGEAKYFAQCLRHLRFMERLCLRADGIYRHSPLDEAAWGRGNGFPALGLALSLSALPEGSVEAEAFLRSYRALLTALRRHQDATGAWHQVVDHEESYREFTSTCMISFAILRGLRRGWLDEAEWLPVVEKAWAAIKCRIGPSGQLVDVCTGTGKMKSLREYLDRTAILGRDERGGAMALMVATEMAFWEGEKAAR